MGGDCSVHATGPLAVIDLETTGTEWETDRIVQVGFIFERAPGDVVMEHEWLVQPGIPIPAQATSVHGITDEMVAADGRSLAVTLETIQTLLAPVMEASVPLVVFNAPFDLTFIAAEFGRQHPEIPPMKVDEWGMVIDPLVIDKGMDRFRKGSRQLHAMADTYRAEKAPAHTAIGDCRTTLNIARRMMERVPGTVDDETLYNKQREWYRAQQENYAAWRASDGRPIELRTAWPMEDVSQNS